MKYLLILTIYLIGTLPLYASRYADSVDAELDHALEGDFGITEPRLLSLAEYEGILERHRLESIEAEAAGAFVPMDPTVGEIATAGILAGAAIVAFANDREIMQFVQENRNSVTEVVSEFGESFGSNATMYGTGAGLILGVVLDNDRIKRVSLMAVKAMAITGLVTRVFKTALGRHRPNEDETKPYVFEGVTTEHHSFPSGHTTQAFAFATVIAEEFKDIKLVPVIAYSAAAVAGWSRVHGTGDGSPAHWASDVLVGAAIGHFVTKQLYRSKIASKGILIMPEVSSRGVNFNVSIQKKDASRFEDPEGFCNIRSNRYDDLCEGSIFDDELTVESRPYTKERLI